MKQFLRDYWLWILIPAMLLCVLLVAAWFQADSGQPPGSYAIQ